MGLQAEVPPPDNDHEGMLTPGINICSISMDGCTRVDLASPQKSVRFYARGLEDREDPVGRRSPTRPLAGSAAGLGAAAGEGGAMLVPAPTLRARWSDISDPISAAFTTLQMHLSPSSSRLEDTTPDEGRYAGTRTSGAQ